MPLELQFPPRSPAGQDGFPARRRALARWLHELEGLDRRERSRRLLDGIKQLNRLEIPPRRRLALLEDLRPSVRSTLDYLASRVHAQTLPLPEAVREIHERNVELLCEASLGYVIVVVAEGPNGRRRRLALAAARTLERHGEWMLRCAQIYTGVPTAFWHTVHTCYATAERAGVTGRRVDAPEVDGGRRRQSVAALYKRILLFSLAGMQGMRRGEAARIHAALAEWADDASLGTDDAVGETTRFAVDLESPQAPLPQDELVLDARSRLRVLGVDAVVERVQRLEDEAPPEDSPLAASNRISAASLRRLVESWHPLAHERSARSPRGEEVDAELTLPVIHARLSAERNPEQPQRRRRNSAVTRGGAALTLQTIEDNPRPAAPGADDAGGGDVQTGAGADWSEIERGQQRTAAYTAAREAEARLYPEGNLPEHPRWLLADVSASGYRLVWDARGGSRAGVGELVGLRLAAEEAGSEQRWSIGVIRRMQFLDDTRFEIGVHALSRNAIPVRVRREPANPNRKRDRQKETSEAGLILPAHDRATDGPSLLLPAYRFRSGEPLEIDLPERRVRATLGAVRENTGAFCEYEIQAPPERGRRATRPGSEGSGPGDPIA